LTDREEHIQRKTAWDEWSEREIQSERYREG
jgi:hypothetical protein